MNQIQLWWKSLPHRNHDICRWQVSLVTQNPEHLREVCIHHLQPSGEYKLNSNKRYFKLIKKIAIKYKKKEKKDCQFKLVRKVPSYHKKRKRKIIEDDDEKDSWRKNLLTNKKNCWKDKKLRKNIQILIIF